MHTHGCYNMRSHSETLWASMMDVFGITWLYESKVYRLPGGGYLPDFYLPHADCFLEVKGAYPTEVERNKAIELEAATGRPVFFAHGRPTADGDYLIHALVTKFFGSRAVDFSVYEVSEKLERMGMREKMREFQRAGVVKPRPTCSSYADILPGILDGMKPRDVFEKERAELCMLLNSQKGDVPATPGDLFIKVIADKCADRMAGQ